MDMLEKKFGKYLKKKNRKPDKTQKMQKKHQHQKRYRKKNLDMNRRKIKNKSETLTKNI
jgi:hypothetical protein